MLVLSPSDVNELRAFAQQNFRGTEILLMNNWISAKMEAQRQSQRAAEAVMQQAAAANDASKAEPAKAAPAVAPGLPAKRAPGRPRKET